MMNTLTFYVIRFAAPTVGVLLIGASSVPYHAIYGWSAVLGGAVALTILGLLWAALRRETAALWIGRTAGQACRRFRAFGRAGEVGGERRRLPQPRRTSLAARGATVTDAACSSWWSSTVSCSP